KLEVINKLVAKIAHELRTHLTSIQTYTHILSEKYKGDEELQNFFATTVIQSIHQLDSLMDKLVIFSSSSDYNFQKEDVNLVLNEAADYVTKNIPGEYKFLNQGIEGTVLINADKKLLIKAIYYLIINVIERVKKDMFITMSAKTVMKDPPRIRISIEYSGEEITDEERQNLLKPLLDINSLGTELNVPISCKIIEGHNGSINIKSEKGTNTFIIDLPSIDRRSLTLPTEEKRVE
ncbi:MAG: hypothetical protein KAI96_05810, partial [Thermodesulfovibrionia bacterium]|nr:hypothetical protein [Thermodesulfovibrionia bacterium]